MLYVIDLETRPDKSLIKTFNEFNSPPKTMTKEETIQAWERKKMSVDIDYADIACIGIKELGGKSEILTPKELEKWFKEHSFKQQFDGQDEVIKKTFEFITFNGKQFDIPLLIKYGLKHDLEYPYKYLNNMTQKWKNAGHYDLMDMIGEWGKYKSLDQYLGIYLGIRKETVGEEFFANATQEELEEHCLQDLDYTEKLFNLFRRII